MAQHGGLGWLGWGAMLASLLAATPALAEGPTGADRARLAELLRAGEAAAKARRWDGCIEAFTEALRLEDAPRTAGELGLCEQQAGRWVDAHGHLDRAMDAAPAEPSTEPWTRYQAALNREKDHVALLFLTVSPPDAKVLLDGRPLGRADGRRIPLAPGTHTFLARLPGYDDAVKTITITAPSYPLLDLALKALPVPASPPVTPAKVAGELGPASSVAPSISPEPRFLPCLPRASVRGVLEPLACLAGVATVAAAVTAGVLEAERASLSVGPTSCGPDVPFPPPRCASLRERRIQRDIAVDFTAGVGIAAAALAGAAAIAYGLERGQASPRLIPAVSANGGGILVLGAW